MATTMYSNRMSNARKRSSIPLCPSGLRKLLYSESEGPKSNQVGGKISHDALEDRTHNFIDDSGLLEHNSLSGEPMMLYSVKGTVNSDQVGGSMFRDTVERDLPNKENSGFTEHDKISQESNESSRCTEVSLVKTASFEDVGHLSEAPEDFRIELNVNDGSNEEAFKEELMHMFERERRSLEMYFEKKVEELLRGFSSRLVGSEGAMRQDKTEFENMLIPKTTNSLQDEGQQFEQCYYNQLKNLGSKRGTDRRQQRDEKFGRVNSELKENLGEMKQEVLRVQSRMEEEMKRDEQLEVGKQFSIRLKETQKSLQRLKDEFETKLPQQPMLMEKQSQSKMIELGERLEVDQYQGKPRKDMSHEKKEIAREKSEMQAKFDKVKLQLEKNFSLRLTTAEANLESLKTELQQRIKMEKESREKLLELEQKLENEYQAMLKRQISRDKEEAIREETEVEARFKREKLRLEQNFILQLSEAETSVKRLKAELKQRIQMEKENRETITKLEAKLQEERQLRLDAERELQQNKAERSNEESFNRNENERLRDEVAALRREIEEKNKEIKMQSMERALQQEKGKYSNQESLDTSGNENLRDEVHALRQEIDEKNKEIERLLAATRENELKVLTLTRRLHKLAKRESKEMVVKRRAYEGRIESPELSKAGSSSEDGEKRPARNSWDLEGSLRGLESISLRADKGTEEYRVATPPVEERKKILVFVTFEKQNEPLIYKLLNTLFPRQNNPTIRVLMTSDAKDQ